MERNVVMISVFAALIAVLGLVPTITLMSGVPISAQSLGVMLCGAVLGARRGALAVLLFLLLVLMGLPLLSGGRGGLGVLAGPTVGFLIGYPIAAFVTGAIVEWLGRRGNVFVATLFASLAGGVVALYVPGIIGMAIVLEKSLVEASVLILPFIPGDIAKAVIAALLTQGLAVARPRSVMSIAP